MRYIRTKDGKIFDLTSKEYVINEDDLILHKQYETITGPDIEPGEMYVPAIAIVRKHNEYHYAGTIEKQADTIEELCDEFISVRDNWHDHWDNFEEPKTLCSESDVYGAIWTEWGLKYVAKMNDEGELELL